jgi:large subunit ribosomal protein L32
MVVHMRHTKGHTGNRRSHHALKSINLVKCAKCDAFKKQHIVCQNCGDYNGRVVIDKLKKIAKKTKVATPKAPKEAKVKKVVAKKAKTETTK